MALNLPKTVGDFLAQHAEQKFTARRIATWIFESFPKECQEKKANSTFIKTDAALVQQIVAEISAQRLGMQKRSPQIKTTEGRPRQYYWTAKSDQALARLSFKLFRIRPGQIFGYLVAAEVQGADTEKELRMLFSLHGIGFIKLNTEDPTESQVLIPARERLEVDWTTCNRLAQENKDFLQFIRLVRQFYQTGDPRPKEWDVHEIAQLKRTVFRLIW